MTYLEVVYQDAQLDEFHPFHGISLEELAELFEGYEEWVECG